MDKSEFEGKLYPTCIGHLVLAPTPVSCQYKKRPPEGGLFNYCYIASDQSANSDVQRNITYRGWVSATALGANDSMPTM